MRTLIIALFLPVFAFSQGYTTLKTTSEKALSAYNEGMQEAYKGQAAIAQGYFEKAIKTDPNFIDAKLALADTYVNLRDFFKAEKYFEEALKMDTAYAPVAALFLAQIEWELDKYEECADHLATYLRSNPSHEKNKKIAKQLLVSASFAASAVKNPVPFTPILLDSNINTKALEYFPSLTADGNTLIFTRRVQGRDEDFYSSTLKDGKWQPAVPLEGVNTNLNEGAQAISPDGSWLVFTACARKGDGSKGSCDLYWSQLKSTGWTKPVPFSGAINSASWESQPTIGADNKTLIYSRSANGVNTPFSLWHTMRQAGGKWSKPEKLPAQINVGGKVRTPFLHQDGQTLYFSSDSLPGMGGCDLFFVRKQDDGSWGQPVNLGYPINTKGEEEMLVVSLDGRTAYYASDKEGGFGGLDIYSFELPEHARPRPVTFARVRVVNAISGYPVTAKVDFIDLKSGQSYVAANTKSDGTALVCLPAGKDYALNVTKDKYLFYSENFNLTEVATFEQPFALNIDLQPIELDTLTGQMNTNAKPTILRNVFFETGSASLRSQSTTELDRLVVMLAESPNLKIQINGHTDNVGDDASNNTLSEQRAKAVHDYLISKGIDANRLKFRGFGETKPIGTNETPEGRARNRRTEFEIW